MGLGGPGDLVIPGAGALMSCTAEWGAHPDPLFSFHLSLCKWGSDGS